MSSSWAPLPYHYISPKHLDRYVNEFVFRLNVGDDRVPILDREETPESGVRRIDMRALERGVRTALAIEPKDYKWRERQERGSQKEVARKNMKE